MKYIKIILLGLTIGAVLFVLIIGAGYCGLRLGTKIIEITESKVFKREYIDYGKILKNFYIGFENPNDLKIFNAQQSEKHITDRFATEGAHSLSVEFPSGQDFPGIFLETDSKSCLDWNAVQKFDIDIYNATAATGRLTVKIKSGRDYPKKEFERTFELPGEQKTTISLSGIELSKSLDMDKISCLNFFMHDPITTFVLYFDNMRVLKE